MTDWSILESRMDAAAFRTFAADAILQPADGTDSRTVRAIVTPEVQRIGEGGYLTVRSEIQVQQSEVAQPAKGDRYTAPAGQTLPGLALDQAWKVDKYEPSGNVWVLIVRKA